MMNAMWLINSNPGSLMTNPQKGNGKECQKSGSVKHRYEEY